MSRHWEALFNRAFGGIARDRAYEALGESPQMLRGLRTARLTEVSLKGKDV